MTYSQDLYALHSPRYAALAVEAKKLRAAARRAEAKGDYAKAEALRAKVEGVLSEREAMRS